jgi:hypothetical protein
MPTELVNLELEEVSLVDMGDDPLAKVAIFKRSPEGEDMEDDVEKGISVEIEIKSPEEEMMDAQMEAQQEAQPMDKADMCENCTDPTCKGCGEADTMAMESDKGYDEKPMRKSWKSEAQAFEEVNKLLLEEVETYKAKISELEAAAVVKVAPVEEMVEVEGQMIAKSAIPAPILKKLEEMQKAVETEALRKRAEEVLPNFKGTADERGKLLKSVGEDEGLLTLLKAADAAFAGVYQEVGKTDAANDLKTATEKLNDLVVGYQEEKKEKDFHKAYAAVIKTAQGRALVLETYKNQ